MRLTIGFCLLILISCTKPIGSEKTLEFQNVGLQRAKLFEIGRTGKKRILRTLDEQGNQTSSIEFSDGEVPQKVVLLNTTYVPYVKALGVQNSIGGIVSFENLSEDSSFLAKGIANVGEKGVLDIEKIQAIQPDLVICSAFQLKDLTILNCPVLVFNEFWETHPLGRAEWIKAFGCLFDAQERADAIFDIISQKYNSDKEIMSVPVSVMNIQRYDAHYFIPSCQAFLNQLFTDAGYSVMCEGKGSKSKELSKEQVIVASQQLDYLVYFDWSVNNSDYSSVLDVLQLKDSFKGKIIYCNTLKTKYFEESILEPDVIIKEMSGAAKNNNFKGKYFSILTPEP